MRFIKIIVTLLFLSSLANVNVCRSGAFQKEKYSSDFGNVQSVAILSQENQAGRKLTHLTGLPKPTLIASSYCFPKNRFSHSGDFESEYVTFNRINEPTLVSLHCLLTV